MHILLTLLAAAAVLVTIPLVLELLLLSIAAALPPRRLPAVSAPAFPLAVLIPAHNEQQLIAACVRSVLASSSSSTTLYVIAHNCTDLTADRASAAGAIVLPLKDSLGGKGNALHHGFTHALSAGAAAILVIDADSTISSNLIRATSEAFAAGAQALQCRYTVANTTENPRTRLMRLALLGMNVLRPRGRSRLGLSSGIFGNGFALSAGTLARVPYIANSVVEDLEYHLHLVRAGIRVDFLDHASVLGEMPETDAGASTQRARWEGGRILMRRQWTMPLLRELLHGHLRFAEPLLDLRSLPLATNAILLLLSLLIPIPWLRAYSAVGLLSFTLYILVAASLGPNSGQTLFALLSIPKYILFKLAMIPKTRMNARRNASWERTQRNDSTPSSTDTSA